MSKKMPRQHEIDELAGRLFASTLPASWRIREQNKDYGIDMEIEIFDDHKTTGIIFKVQLKGTENPIFLADQSFICLQLRKTDANYFCEEISIPVILILVDVSAKKAWWHPIQLDTKLQEENLKKSENHKSTVVLHINPENSLPSSLNNLFNKIRESQIYLAIKKISKTSPELLQAAINFIPDIDSIHHQLSQQISNLNIIKLAKAWDAKDIDSLEDLINEITCNNHSSIVENYHAYFYLELLERNKLQLPAESDNLWKIEYKFAMSLKSIGLKNGPLYIRLLAIFAFHASLLHRASDRDYYLFLNSLVNSDERNKSLKDPLWGSFLPVIRINSTMSVIRKLNHCVQYINIIINKGQIQVIPECIARLQISMIIFLNRIYSEQLPNAAKNTEDFFQNLCDIGIKISLKLKNWKNLVLILLNSTHLCNVHDEISINNRFAWIEKEINLIEDESIREEAKKLAQLHKIDMLKYIQQQTSSKMDPDPDIEKQVYENMAIGMGIDLKKPDDPISQIIKIGIADLNPERVLKNCEHLYVTTGSIGIPGRMLMLPTAGSKSMFCTFHGYGIGGLSLDSIYSLFKDKYCINCKEKKPHPDDWKWSHIWQRGEIEKHKHKFKSFM